MIRGRRALEIGGVLGQAVVEGFSLGFGTFTMRHRKGQPLEALWGAARKAWTRAITGSVWSEAQDAYGVEGWVRVWEVTDGENGWHVHVHFVVVLPEGASTGDLDAVCSGMWQRWSRGLTDSGLQAPLLRGQDWHLVEGDAASDRLAEYLAKVGESAEVVSGRARSIGLELTHTEPGRARAGLATRPVWSILDELVETGDVEVMARWQEWERGSKGRRQVGWSQRDHDLRKRFRPELVIVTDEEAANKEIGTAADDVVHIPLDGWKVLVRRPGDALRVLEETERGGAAGASRVLTEIGVPHSVVELVEAVA